MSPAAFRLLRALSTGRWLSGEQRASDLGVSRAAVWKLVGQLRDAGVPVEARRGDGYRLAWPVDLLDRQRIAPALDDSGATLEIVEHADSTNSLLARRFVHRHAIAAEYQRNGRGRRGRHWLSPPASGVWLSYAYRFECGLPRLGALGLMAGVAAADAVERACGVPDDPLQLKWPNDLMIDGRKLGGILVEIRGPADGPCEVVIGVGINVRLPVADDRAPDQPWIDLHGAGVGDPDRNRLTGTLVRELDRACGEFERFGFEPFMTRWEARDALAGHRIRVCQVDGTESEGCGGGVTRRGELCLFGSDGSRRLFGSGEVSVRAA
ncbi:MAG: biotin--[acetyl-CoA-carboxylase] ligase [Candidatus Wenzhouxiangella sp. M2_3B_020]